MRLLVLGLTTCVAGLSFLSATPAGARCSYVAMYPTATGKKVYMLATATSDSAVAPVDSLKYYTRIPVRAQVMRIDSVAGYQSDIVKRGLIASKRAAVFVRYLVSAGCGPFPAQDGAFDSVGVNGLYVGEVRPIDRWIDGRPTFDIVMAPHFPLPQRLSGPSGHLVMTRVDSAPVVMTAGELFTMYRTLWAESTTVRDNTIERRIKTLLKNNPAIARKQPASEIVHGLFGAMANATNAAYDVPFAGTYAINVIVPGIDSVLLYGRTFDKTRPWQIDLVKDSATGIPLSATQRNFAVDIVTSHSTEAYPGQTRFSKTCAYYPIIVPQLPIVARGDSTWTAQIEPDRFLSCSSDSTSPLSRLRGQVPSSMLRPQAEVIFRRHADCGITLESLMGRDGTGGIIIRGQRISTVTNLQRY